MTGHILDEFNTILKSLDGLSTDKIQDFMVKIIELFKKIHFNAEHGTEREKKEALDFASQIQESFAKIQAKLDKNLILDSNQFKNLFAFLEEDMELLAKQKKTNASLPFIKKQSQNVKPRKKKKVIKKV